jgi:hypothetical protein
MNTIQENGALSCGARVLHWRNLLRGLVAACLTLALVSCASQGQRVSSPGTDYLPGGAQFYSYGFVSDKAYFIENVERAQEYLGLFTAERNWGSVSQNSAPNMIGALQSYYPLSVRWKLKDGREFLIDQLDLRPALREYFKTQDIQLQWQRERRPFYPIGDTYPSLVFQIKDDSIILKWVMRINHTPVKDRATTLWNIEREEHYITTIKASPAKNIDFDNTREILKK